MNERLLDLLRHGEVQGGARFRGDQDDPLSERGWEQMRLATESACDWTEIISSPSCRCADFARQLAEQLGLPFSLEPAIAERGFGAWEGLAAYQIPPDELSRFWDDPVGYTPPDGEPFAEFRDRVRQARHDILARYGEHPLLVTHGGVIRMLVAETLQMPDEAILLVEVPYACFTRLRILEAPGRPSLVFHRGQA